jgi:hypothetical protein
VSAIGSREDVTEPRGEGDSARARSAPRGSGGRGDGRGGHASFDSPSTHFLQSPFSLAASPSASPTSPASETITAPAAAASFASFAEDGGGFGFGSGIGGSGAVAGGGPHKPAEGPEADAAALDVNGPFVIEDEAEALAKARAASRSISGGRNGTGHRNGSQATAAAGDHGPPS